jgi:hypothetical protein
LNGTCHLLVRVDDINLVGENIHTTEKNTEALLEARREVSLEVNTEKTKYMVMSHHQNEEQNYDLLRANEFLENVAKFKYLGTIVTDKIVFMKKLRPN